MNKSALRSRVGAVVAALIVSGCSEPLAPTSPEMKVTERGDGILTSMVANCSVDVGSSTLTCDDTHLTPSSANGLRTSILLGNQDVFVKLTSSGTSYDNGTQILRSDLVLQNLIRQMVGTTDGSTVTGTQIFFHSGPTVTGGTGVVTLNNADGTETFTAAGQPYFLYNEILQPYQISSSKEWRFNVPSTVTTFTFQLLIKTSAPNEALPFLDKVWDGESSTAWETASNWNGAVPDASSTVSVPPASFITSGNMPVLAGNASVTNLKVGTGSTLGLGGFSMTVSSNFDAQGTISNGTMLVTGASAYIGGTVDKLGVSGGAVVQRALKATGAVNVTGSLSVKNNTLTIAIP